MYTWALTGAVLRAEARVKLLQRVTHLVRAVAELRRAGGVVLGHLGAGFVPPLATTSPGRSHKRPVDLERKSTKMIHGEICLQVCTLCLFF